MPEQSILARLVAKTFILFTCWAFLSVGVANSTSAGRDVRDCAVVPSESGCIQVVQLAMLSGHKVFALHFRI